MAKASCKKYRFILDAAIDYLHSEMSQFVRTGLYVKKRMDVPYAFLH